MISTTILNVYFKNDLRKNRMAQLAGAAEYTNYISVEG